MAIEPIAPPQLPIPPSSGFVYKWARDLTRGVSKTLRDLTYRANQTVFLTDDQTITGEKTIADTLQVFDILAGPRYRQLTRGAGSSQPNTQNSDCWITTDGALTIPTTANGLRYFIVLGGDHDITFNSTTCDVSAEGWGTGDILFAFVESATVCKLWRLVATADLGAFS